ncbi:MAG: Pyrophosphate--fructose 6-phosphate 1-phosphotransferase [Firmicutes bacterium ADurb.Bin193]|nr:MAG: Pyrophosphate--fructose 6-phosphate 1-phosphotransferase [Firmicutes bacterium ADurb.Bin193]
MQKPRNVIVSQSGGPTPVINNSLRGVIEACRDYPDVFGTVYAGFHGVEGILKEELLDLSAQSVDEISLLRTTPTAGSVGTCRYKLKSSLPEDFERVIDVLRAHNVGYLFYIGGNDSMDTANKISILARERGLELIAVGVPKTIDNDVGDSEFKLIDHTPGYGSVAKYWSVAVQNANEENAGSCPADPVLVLQAMGRKIGYIPAAARLADPNREMPLRIYMAESGLSLEEIAEDVNSLVEKRGRALVVVSEGLNIGDLGETKDNFGHTQFGASQITVAQKVVNYLNSVGLRTRGAARGQVSGTDQRGNINTASAVDLDEAYCLGQKAVEIAASNSNGFMSTILRNPGPIYSVRYDRVPLELVANSERTFPQDWLTKDKNDVTDEFIKYAKPLIGNDWVSVPLVDGIMRFAKLKPIFAEKKLGAYVPQGYRE